jgi:hypothetical protein
MSGGPWTPELMAAARTLAHDRVCAEVVAAWQAEGIEPVLLKGMTVADWLYPGEVRDYVDTDLLVPPAHIERAAAVLSRLGFSGIRPDLVRRHSEPWWRASDDAEIDLHVSLWGADRPATWVWAELRSHLETRRVGPVTVSVLDPAARALCVVLHAAQHGGLSKQREDLVRALALTPDSLWSDVEDLAHRLWALVGLADGLLLLPEGREVLGRLPLAQAATMLPRAPLAIGFARLAGARGLRAKLDVLFEAIQAPREDGLSKSPRGLARLVAFAGQRLRLLATAPRTILVLWRARRSDVPRRRHRQRNRVFGQRSSGKLQDRADRVDRTDL